MSSYFSPRRDVLSRLNSQSSNTPQEFNKPLPYYPRRSKTPLQKLPHLQTPPASPGVLDLRRSTYGVVPPLKSQKPSWKRRYLSRQDAAIIIQRYYRGWSVRKGPRFRPWRYMCHKRFGRDFVQKLVEETLVEHIFPELLVEVLGRKRTNTHPKPATSVYGTTEEQLKGICDTIISETVQSLVRQTVNEVFHGHISFKSRMTFNHSVLTSLSGDILEEFLREERVKIVHETINGLVTDHIMLARSSAWLGSFIDEAIGPLVHDMAIQCLKEAKFESPYDELLQGEIREVASQVHKEVHTEKLEKEYDEVMKCAQNCLADSLCLEHLLTLINGNDHKIYYDDYMDKLLDGYIVDILLGVYFSVSHRLESTTQCFPLEELHQDITTDIAMNVILDELVAQLDEDMLDAHEQEQIIKN